MASRLVVAAVGDVADPSCWSGIPYYFLRAAQESEIDAEPIRVNLAAMKWPRRNWVIKRAFFGKRPRGFQYSLDFLNALESQVPRHQFAGEVISFNQHFPRASTVRAAGGRITYYIDATFAALSQGRGLELNLPEDVSDLGKKLERENYELAERVVAMASWTAESLVTDCNVPKHKVKTILPGANLELPTGWTPETPPGRPGIDRPFVLGFVGKDWKRKGLPLVCQIQAELTRMGWKVGVLAAGDAPRELKREPGIEFVGFLDKRNGTAAFVKFLSRCDVGCLFSTKEALGISTLEFLRVGVPVAGYAIEGPADTLPIDAGFRFHPDQGLREIVSTFDRYLRSEDQQCQFRANAIKHSTYVTWQRCVAELKLSFWDYL